MSYPRSLTEISTVEIALATHYSAVVSRHALTPAVEGREVTYLQVAKGIAPQPRTPVLFVGGIHARELAPPAALLSLVGLLAKADATNSGITIGSLTISAADVQRILTKLELCVLPMANPDGREFAQTHDQRWRKNRRVNPSGGGIGVDINRNFDIAWDYEKYYNSYAAFFNSASKDPSHELLYIGHAAASEIETRNIVALIDGTAPGVSPAEWFVDVHSYHGSVFYPWAIERNGSDATMHWRNTAWDTRRDGLGLFGGDYTEHFPPKAQSHRGIALMMAAGANETTTVRNRVNAHQLAVELYTATGSSMDYAFSRSIVDPNRSVFAFTIECGEGGEGEFTPSAAQYGPIENKVHGSLLVLLRHIASEAKHPEVGEPPCFIATAVYGDPDHRDVVFLRTLRDEVPPATRVGYRIVPPIVRAYGRLGPPAARWLASRPRLARALRRWMFEPAVNACRRLVGENGVHAGAGSRVTVSRRLPTAPCDRR
jgi:zinc carboxypeptidase